MDKKRVLLFAMTGFGNNAFMSLLEIRAIRLIAVFTPKCYTTPFPYYKCEQLQDVVSKYCDIQLFEDVSMKASSTAKLIQELYPDLIVMSSFNQIIPQEVIFIPRTGIINVHPSLLPRYRGSTPTNWALMNGEEETGITVHFVENGKIDSGRIIVQSRLKIDARDTDGMLRHKLAVHSEDILCKAIFLVFKKDRKMFPNQDEANASYYTKITSKDAEIYPQQTIREISNRIRAVTPYPGAYIKYNGFKYLIHSASIVKNIDPCNRGGNIVFIKAIDGVVKFEVEKKEQNGKKK